MTADHNAARHSPTATLMALTSKYYSDEACLNCKTLKQGADVCTNDRQHCRLQSPGTPLSWSHCQALRKFRANVFYLEDQLRLQRAQASGGSTAVLAMLEDMKTEPPPDTVDLNERAPVEVTKHDYEWSLSMWPETNDKDYDFVTIRL